MKQWAKKILSGKDNDTPDLGRWSWALSWTVVTIVAIWQVVHGVAIDLLTLAGAYTGIGAGHGIAIGAKASTEPEVNSKEPP
jgi:hypothetical protein